MDLSVVRPYVEITKKTKMFIGYENIVSELKKKNGVNTDFTIAFECYPTTNEELLKEKLINLLRPDNIISSDRLFMSDDEVTEKIKDNLTDDRIFGLMSHHKISDFINHDSFSEINTKNNKGLTVIYGFGASLIETVDLIIYVDLSRWEIQKRYRSGKYSNWKAKNFGEDSLKMIKRGYFFEWQVADRYKREIFNKIDYFMDFHDESEPKMIEAENYYNALREVIKGPFSLVPFFDPGVWGGHWMQETFGIDKEKDNLAWSFNGVPEENSLILSFDDVKFELPANNIVFLYPEELLGKKVYGRFGHDFPIRFNFLDTMGGQNLSLQVHPKISYAQMNFGIHYTQDESYYVLEAKEDAVVYLGVKNGTDKKELIQALEEAELTGEFDDQKYINNHSMKKHDHYLIPSGTIHSSGKNSVVLEISATPNRFTFKLWDWDRVDFDGLPRPVNINHGRHNIDIYKDQDWTEKELINNIKLLGKGDGWKEERTGLHESEFIETRRHKFTKKVLHKNHKSVNVLNLVEGKEALITSPDNSFKPFKLNYAQTVIIPETIREYYIEPFGESIGSELITIKAFVR